MYINMKEDKAYEMIDIFIKTRAEKYRALDERNEFVKNRVNGIYKPTPKEIEEYNNQFNKCSEKALEGEYRVNNYISKAKLYDLNRAFDLVKRYSKRKEKEIDELSIYILPEFDHERPIQIVEYYEKYERPSIKDLIYLIARAKGKLFGMDDEEAFNYASHEMEQLIDIDILGLSTNDLRKKIRKRD